MSLKQFVERQIVRDRLDPLISAIERPRQQPATLVHRSVSRDRASLLGTAVDYALRFELGRRCPHALEGPWAAYGALNRLPGELIHRTGSSRPWEHAARVLHAAEQTLRAYRLRQIVEPKEIREMAGVALSLASLDFVYRLRFNPFTWNEDFTQVDPLEIDEICGMLEHAPFATLTTSETMILNPTFGRYSHSVGGADADLVIGDTLIDIKATQDAKVTREHLRQLFGYFLLARAMRKDDPRFPEIKNLGLFFPRFGFCWRFPTQVLTSQPSFTSAEAWFIQQPMNGKTLPAEQLEVRSVRDWLESEPRQFGAGPDSISSTLPSEELNAFLLERFERTKPPLPKKRRSVRMRPAKKAR